MYSHGWDERDEQCRQEYEAGWESAQNNFSREGNINRGGITGAPGSNYAAGTFGGAGEGLGFEDDKYRGYFGGESSAAHFADRYTHSYGRDDYRTYGHEDYRGDKHRDVRGERYGSGSDRSYPRQRWEDYNWADRASARPEGDWRREDGPHRGKGPKNYHRPDSRIREDVSDRLSDDPYIDASDIDISVEEGNVVLSGRVENRDAKRRAADLAESVRGVSNVENRLRTGQGLMENVSHAFTAAIGDVILGPDVSTVEEPPKKGRKRKSP